ncbi:uncharacterized protein TNCV_4337051 [Trichonephila clavipes]|nr:uncharacterized protein TNCV_4337051 [Trichonephila clavipes]
MPISNDSYEEAWQKLLNRYDNKKQIVQSLIKTFLDQKPISEANCFNLRKLLDTSDGCLRGLNALGQNKSCVDLVIGSQSSNERLEVNAFILNEVTSQIPSEFLDVKDLDYLKSIPLPDEEFMSPKESSAPYLATRCLFQTGLDLERDDPAVLSLIKESFYIDDFMAGATSIIWLLKLDWDSPLPEALATKWNTFQKEFEKVCSIHIPRWIHTASQQITLHGFCDASELAYASVIYAVQPQADDWGLNGALLLARLYATCKNILKEYEVHFYAWTDSQVVLSWLSSHPKNWKPYIANRTSEILDLVPADSWRYVPTKMNPADIACRGLSPKELPTCILWWEGPQWLSCEMDSWPKQPRRNYRTSSVSKERKRTAFSFPVAVKCDFVDSLFFKFSSFTKIIDIFAFCFRYITNCKARVGKMKNLDSKGKYHVPPLTTYERRQASNKIFLYIQNLFFKEEISCIKANKPVVKKSILSALFPFIDKDGVIRVGGRLQNSTLQYSAKHPIILPNQHEICKLIVRLLPLPLSIPMMINFLFAPVGISSKNEFVWTFPIHGIRDDSVGQRETIVPNTQHGQTLVVEKDMGIFLGSGHQLLCIRGSPKPSGFKIRPSVLRTEIGSRYNLGSRFLRSSFRLFLDRERGERSR